MRERVKREINKKKSSFLISLSIHVVVFSITSLTSTHIYPLQLVQGMHSTHQKLFICFLFSVPKTKSTNNAANVLKLNIYISINYLWHTLWHLAGPGAESSRGVRDE